MYQNYIDRSLSQYSWEIAILLGNNQRPFCILPSQCECCTFSSFTAVMIILVLVLNELAICSGINPQIYVAGRLVSCVLQAGLMGRIESALIWRGIV